MTPTRWRPTKVASRLSYLVYACMPDEPLFAAAKAGQLATAKDVQTQLQRMLTDSQEPLRPELHRTVARRAHHRDSQPDAKLYPAFSVAFGHLDEEARSTSTSTSSVRQNLPAEQLLTANSATSTPAGQALRLAAVAGTALTRVTLATPQRGGLFGHGRAVARHLTREPHFAGGTRSLGLDALMCAPPPPPPDTVKLPSEDVITAHVQPRLPCDAPEQRDLRRPATTPWTRSAGAGELTTLGAWRGHGIMAS